MIEITERVALNNTPIAQSVLAFVRALGCPLAIDDFAGPEAVFRPDSLDLLGPDYLKIDGSVTHRLPDPIAIADINAYCAIAHARGIKVILEQVEISNLDVVRTRTHVDLIQGWAVGIPQLLG
jgi:EAL domain-containing protein (putative c-di-GMP-specific phosphodiesterase class I)